MYSELTGKLSEVLDDELHDSVIVGVCGLADTDVASRINVLGIFPNLQHLYELDFSRCSNSDFRDMRIGAQFGVKQLTIDRANESLLVIIHGEFEGQRLSFNCSEALFRKFELENPLDREAMGWA